MELEIITNTGYGYYGGNMANTNKLKYIVEPVMKRQFCEKYACELIPLSNKQLQIIFSGMEPDVVAISHKNNILHIGEITTSGFMGQKGRDFHIGAVKKISEAFSKFYLILLDKDEIIQRLCKYYNIEAIDKIDCHFIVPEGAKFINALGYREKLFDIGVMKLDIIKLDYENEKLMLQVLMDAKKEMELP